MAKLIPATLLELKVEEVVNLDLDGALEAVLEEMRLLDEFGDELQIWEDVSCLDLDDFPMLEPVWADACVST